MKAVDRIVYALRWRERRREAEDASLLLALSARPGREAYATTLATATGLDLVRTFIAMHRLDAAGRVLSRLIVHGDNDEMLRRLYYLPARPSTGVSS